jgi:hypothetical protein
LETKVKRLEEERELNVRGNGIFQEKPNLEELRERSELHGEPDLNVALDGEQEKPDLNVVLHS